MNDTTPMETRKQDRQSPALGSGRLVRRGDVKRFREHLNRQDDGIPHRNFRFHQRTRKYGDYLYAQDREKFMVDLREWLLSPNSGDVPRPRAGGAESETNL